MLDPGTAMCKAKVGLLVLRGCGDPAIGACALCGMPLCSQHMVTGQDGGIRCPDCGLRDPDMASRQDLKEGRERESYYDEYGYHPYMYWGMGRYSSRDHETLAADQKEAGAGFPDTGPPDGDTKDEDAASGEYDDMES